MFLTGIGDEARARQAAQPALDVPARRLQQVQGMGALTVRTLVAELPELGTLACG